MDIYITILYYLAYVRIMYLSTGPITAISTGTVEPTGDLTPPNTATPPTTSSTPSPTITVTQITGM